MRHSADPCYIQCDGCGDQTEAPKVNQFVCADCGKSELWLTIVVDPNTMNTIPEEEPQPFCLNCSGTSMTRRLQFEVKRAAQDKADEESDRWGEE